MNFRGRGEKLKAPDKDVKCVLIKSQLLKGEMIALIMKPTGIKCVKENYPDLVTYYTPEIEALYKHKQDKGLIKQVHSTKKIFGGVITAEKIAQGRNKNENNANQQLSIKCI